MPVLFLFPSLYPGPMSVVQVLTILEVEITIQGLVKNGSLMRNVVVEAWHHLPHPRVPQVWHPHLRPAHLKLHTLDSFQSSNFRLLWGSTAASSAAFWAQQIVIGWLTFSLTESPMLTVLVLGLDALPILFLGPLGGMLVDSWDRRRLLVAISAYQAALTLGFTALVFMGMAGIWNLFLFSALMGFGWVFIDPVRMSLIPSLVPKQHVFNAFALNGVAYSVTKLVAPALVGLVMAVAGVGFGLVVEVALLLASVVLAYKLHLTIVLRPPFRMLSAAPKVLEGVRFVQSHPVILWLICAAVVPSALGTPFVLGLMPVYAAEVFHKGPIGLGLLLAAIGGGATAGTMLLASFGGVGRHGSMLAGCAALMIGGILAFSLNPWFYSALPILMLFSAGMMVLYATCSAAIICRVPDELRGRVSGLYTLNWGLSPFGSVAAGALAERLGAPEATLWAGAAMAAVFVLLALVSNKAWWAGEEDGEIQATREPTLLVGITGD